MSNKSAVFIDISSFPAGSIKGKQDDNNLSIPANQISFIQEDDHQSHLERMYLQI